MGNVRVTNLQCTHHYVHASKNSTLYKIFIQVNKIMPIPIVLIIIVLRRTIINKNCDNNNNKQ